MTTFELSVTVPDSDVKSCAYALAALARRRQAGIEGHAASSWPQTIGCHATSVNEKLTNLNRVSNWTAVVYGILECAGFLRRWVSAGRPSRAGHRAGNRRLRFHQLKRLTMHITRVVGAGQAGPHDW